MTDKPYRVGIWCAVSSKTQAADDKISLPAQQDAGRQFAATLLTACQPILVEEPTYHRSIAVDEKRGEPIFRSPGSELD